MADLPILFSAPMVRALLDGRKTQTRRIIELPTKGQYVHPQLGGWAATTVGGGKSFYADGSPAPEKVAIWQQTTGTVISMRFQRGDHLWVRETHYRYGHWQPIAGKKTKGGRQKWGFVATTDEVRFAPPAEYRKGRHHKDPATPAWHKRLARFMPRWASRLTLTVTDVRVQRLQEISEADCIAEGIEEVTAEIAASDKSLRFWKRYRDGAWNSYVDCPIQSYASLWTEINGEGAWETNPWVVALTFTVERRNIDAIPPSYLIWSNEHGLWWRANRAGYCADVSEAGRYSREEAIAQCATGRDGFTASRVPPELPVREIDAINQAGRSINDLVLKADRTECRMRDLASKARVA